MKQFKIILFSLLVCWKYTADASGKTIPVMYGGDDDLDACSALAVVANLSDGADEFLAVKAAPSIKAKRVDKLLKGQSLWICEEKNNWYGVVYARDEKQDCGVSTPVGKRMPYTGPCKSGWVHKKYVKPIAG